MQSKYPFWNIFGYNTSTGFLYPKFTIDVNGVILNAWQPIPQGLSFGGINLYSYIGKDIAGTWDSTARVLRFAGFYG